MECRRYTNVFLVIFWIAIHKSNQAFCPVEIPTVDVGNCIQLTTAGQIEVKVRISDEHTPPTVKAGTSAILWASFEIEITNPSDQSINIRLETSFILRRKSDFTNPTTAKNEVQLKIPAKCKIVYSSKFQREVEFREITTIMIKVSVRGPDLPNVVLDQKSKLVLVTPVPNLPPFEPGLCSKHLNVENALAGTTSVAPVKVTLVSSDDLTSVPTMEPIKFKYGLSLVVCNPRGKTLKFIVFGRLDYGDEHEIIEVAKYTVQPQCKFTTPFTEATVTKAFKKAGNHVVKFTASVKIGTDTHTAGTSPSLTVVVTPPELCKVPIASTTKTTMAKVKAVLTTSTQSPSVGEKVDIGLTASVEILNASPDKLLAVLKMRIFDTGGNHKVGPSDVISIPPKCKKIVDVKLNLAATYTDANRGFNIYGSAVVEEKGSDKTLGYDEDMKTVTVKEVSKPTPKPPSTTKEFTDCVAVNTGIQRTVASVLVQPTGPVTVDDIVELRATFTFETYNPTDRVVELTTKTRIHDTDGHLYETPRIDKFPANCKTTLTVHMILPVTYNRADYFNVYGTLETGSIRKEDKIVLLVKQKEVDPVSEEVCSAIQYPPSLPTADAVALLARPPRAYLGQTVLYKLFADVVISNPSTVSITVDVNSRMEETSGPITSLNQRKAVPPRCKLRLDRITVYLRVVYSKLGTTTLTGKVSVRIGKSDFTSTDKWVIHAAEPVDAISCSTPAPKGELTKATVQQTVSSPLSVRVGAPVVHKQKLEVVLSNQETANTVFTISGGLSDDEGNYLHYKELVPVLPKCKIDSHHDREFPVWYFNTKRVTTKAEVTVYLNDLTKTLATFTENKLTTVV